MKPRNRHLRTVLWSLTLAALTLWSVRLHAGSPPDAGVELKQAAAVTHHLVLLSDVAEITSLDPSLKKALENLAVDASPGLCREARLDAEKVRQRITDDFPRLHIQVSGASSVQVIRSCRTVTESELEEAGKKYIFSHMPWKEETVEVTDVRVPELVFPDLPVSVEFSESTGEDFLGNISLMALIKHNGETLRAVRWTGRISVFENVVVAARTLDRDQLITADDVTLRQTDLSQLHTEPLRSLDGLAGKRVIRRIPEGNLVRHEDLDRPLLVQRGDRVFLKAQTAMIEVTATGVALDDGSLGDAVRVRNLSSKREIVGLVAGPHWVKVVF